MKLDPKAAGPIHLLLPARVPGAGLAVIAQESTGTICKCPHGARKKMSQM